jgi:hypothetical protein
MGKGILIVAFAVAAVVPATASVAAVNCNIINRELKLGKWPADVALDQGVTLADVKDCKAKPAAAQSSTTPKTGTTPKRTAPAKTTGDR